MTTSDVLIIGGGPSGAVSAALLARAGHDVTVLERSRFPRFSIGESLLPQCMAFIDQAGMLRPVVEAGYQYKNGAVFARRGDTASFDFRDKSSPGWGTTYQVVRADFDQLLLREAERAGARVLFEHEILSFTNDGSSVRLEARDAKSQIHTFCGRFVLDASGFGRVLPRLLSLERPSSFPLRKSLFTHVADNIRAHDHDRNKILIAVHPDHDDVWYWLIPFQNGRCSLGVVAADGFIGAHPGALDRRLKELVDQEPTLHRWLASADFDTPVREIGGYAADVSSLCGPSYALLGNAGEFLDPIFSSGVTIAMKSAALAAPLVSRQLAGETIDWKAEFETPLRRGVDTFRGFVEAWYRGDFQRIVFFERHQPRIKRMLCSILAGYAWDDTNPYVAHTARRLAALEQACRAP